MRQIGEIIIDGRYNGPPDSGNGGYSCGMLAAFVDGPARVRLHLPPPLDRPLRVQALAPGSVGMYDGDSLVGSASPTTLELTPPPPPSLAQAKAATGGFPCYTGHRFPTCFVCGPERPGRDGLAIFPGPVGDGDLVACPWRPATGLLDGAGQVRPEFVWAVLDCPGYYAAMGDNIRHAVLGELDGDLRAPVAGGEPLVVYAWPVAEEGRKLRAGSAIATGDGKLLAVASSIWIITRQ
jgi:hypothetical protein